jgi:hypothetical protein
LNLLNQSETDDSQVESSRRELFPFNYL